MAGRHSLCAVVLFAAVLHTIAITRTILPAQDGLKFIRIARQFQTQPWADVVRASDSHPLYPALIAATEPLFAWIAGHGADNWRIAAQVVAVVGSVVLILPVYGLARRIFDRRIACIAAALAVLLPRAAELGHDTLSDSLGLSFTFLALYSGGLALGRGDWRAALGSGLAAGLGYLARPEVVLVPAAIGLTGLVLLLRDSRFRTTTRIAALALILLSATAVFESYALVKGEISEKLALRYGAALGPRERVVRRVPQQLPRGLDDPRWDFSPKEETDRIPIRNWRYAVLRIAGTWWEELCWLGAVMTVWGLVRHRFIRELCLDRAMQDDSGVERLLLFIFATVYGLALVRHSVLLGYLSGRHVMALVYASLPWAAAGLFVCARGIAVKLHWSARTARWAAALAGGIFVAASIIVQMQPSHLNHLSRWGHWAAGQWLASHARPSELVLDTRGWARFVSAHPGYDYWHVRQALTDAHLSYVIVGLDELEAKSSRARTLKALLSYAATPLLEFPSFPGDRTAGVRLYRFRRPNTWEGLVP
jgi:4-amino-4-deoxy-L-arabinose transferase-like glycosyltransferase